MMGLKDQPYGPTKKKLFELTDEELLQEITRRRELRNPNATRRTSAPPQRIRQYFANLELDPTATLRDVERAYRLLIQKYDPDKHVDDVDKHSAAKDLSASLTAAYSALLDYLQRRD